MSFESRPKGLHFKGKQRIARLEPLHAEPVERGRVGKIGSRPVQSGSRHPALREIHDSVPLFHRDTDTITAVDEGGARFDPVGPLHFPCFRFRSSTGLELSRGPGLAERLVPALMSLQNIFRCQRSLHKRQLPREWPRSSTNDHLGRRTSGRRDNPSRNLSGRMSALDPLRTLGPDV